MFYAPNAKSPSRGDFAENELILGDLQTLAKEEMVLISPSETLQFFITQLGLDKISTQEQSMDSAPGFILHEQVIEG